MWWSALVLVLLLVPAFSAWRDPRKFRTGVYLLIALVALVIVGFGLIVVGVDEAGAFDRVRGYLVLATLLLILVVVIVLGVALVFNGVTVIRREGLRLSHALPLALGLGILAYVAAGVTTVVLNSSELFVWLAAVGLPLALLGFGFTAFLLYAALYQWGVRHFARPVDTIVVLGSGLRAGDVTPLLASRLNVGQAVWERSVAAGRDPVLVVSGGQGRDEPRSEAAAMAAYVIDHGVPAADVLSEEWSHTTEENLRYSRAVLVAHDREGRIAVVTNNFHAFRAALLMRAAGLPGYAVGSPTAGYYWPSATIREYVAILRDHLAVTLILLGLTCLPLIAAIVNAL